MFLRLLVFPWAQNFFTILIEVAITSLISGLWTKLTNLGGQKSQKVDFEKVFPPFHGFSTKTVPDFCGFQYLRISLSPKNQRISGTPCN